MDTKEITQTEIPKRHGRPDWKPGMPSPNPKGRPKGISDRRNKLRDALEKDAPAIIEKVIQQALAGDMQAASLVLNRISPPLRNQAEKVEFEFDPSQPVVTQCEQVMLAVAQGRVSPDIGKGIIETIASVQGIRQVIELEQRLTLLEQQ